MTMASISNLCSPLTHLSSSSSTFKPKPYFSFASPSIRRSTPSRPILCKRETSDGSSVDRRDVLIGIGGSLYGATSGLILPGGGKTLASPIVAPDIAKCGPADLPNGAIPTNCCPPVPGKIVDYVPDPPKRIRVRPSAHSMTKEEVEKLEEAVRRMKALPADDPRSFTQQANIHCAYCDGGYDQVGFPELEIQVHNSWLFFPFHRWYLYFYEKILGKLIGDDDFVMPFWNYDNPAGMTMPPIFANPKSPLYDPIRDQDHLPPKIIDLDFGTDANLSDDQRIQNNLNVMNRQMIGNSKKSKQFFGAEYVAGTQPSPGQGSIESVPHGPVHVWSGDPRQPNRENMGNFYSAGRDPLFYCHHSNIDRLWNVWKQISKKNRDPNKKDFLESSFLFYDENAQAVRVRVGNCLETSLLGYRYESVEIPWLEKKPSPAAKQGKTSAKQRKFIKDPKFPVVLTMAVSTRVKRPVKSRTAKEKEDEEEVVVIEGIEIDRDLFAKFDVYVNSPDNAVTPGNSEFAGSFVNVPHKHKHSKKEMALTTNLTLGLTDLLDDIKADDDDDIIVTLVPRKGKGKIKIGGVSIQFLKDDD